MGQVKNKVTISVRYCIVLVVAQNGHSILYGAVVLVNNGTIYQNGLRFIHLLQPQYNAICSCRADKSVHVGIVGRKLGNTIQG